MARRPNIVVQVLDAPGAHVGLQGAFTIAEVTGAAGDPILEIDHIHDLAKDGPDDPIQMIALCPNCHAVKTRSRDREQLRQRLFEVARQRHQDLI
jgi:predicted HNH restriction endonuclease